ncbi:MAG TPA: anti-anti-sigma factor [Gammaproteobacteria bacterium]|jgi:anti-anti-sigma factor|nr:anti-anti-sigma factor [Gammaproteobacteria bacterium]
MTISTKISNDGKELTIKVEGRFDFNAHREFRAAYEQAKSNSTKFVVDMAETDYMDSSALGMLLLLREKVGGDNANISIVKCKPEIRQIFDISNFKHMFHIE